MDKYIANFPAVDDGDLKLCHQQGVAYQADMTITASYDEAYFGKYVGYEGTEIASAINKGRREFVDRFVGPETDVLDIGVGSGEFIKSRQNTWGYDVNPIAEDWLKDWGFWQADLTKFKAFTFWDVLEHVPDPDFYFQRIASGSHVFISIPIFNDLTKIRESKHYRPGEHLVYFTVHGLVGWMECHGFLLQAISNHETDAGRDSIKSFAFKRQE
jgi:hypothetical protein